jgi:hypothetical protein
LSETFWKGKRAKLESQQRKLALDLAEGQEREQLMHKLLKKVVQREAAGREAAVEQLQAELARTKLDAEVNLQKTAAYWITKLAEQDQASGGKVQDAELSAQATQEMQKAAVQVAALEAELSSSKLDAEVHLQKTAAFWITKLAEQDQASREKVQDAELSAEAQQQLQKAQLEVAALEAELRIASLAAETNLQKTASFWISKLAEAQSEAEVQRARASALELELERAGLWQALASAGIQEQPAEVAPAAEEKAAAPAADVESAQTPAERAAALRAAYDARVAKERAERR